MKMIIATLAATCLFAGAASAKDATCAFTVDGEVIMDGPCDFTPKVSYDGTSDGSFQVDTQDGYFVSANKTDEDGLDGVRAAWNGHDRDRRAHEEIGILIRQDGDPACWSNERALLCAW